MKRKAYIDYDRCDNSSRCLAKKRCLAKAFERKNSLWIINDNCTACGACVHFCTQSCIEIKSSPPS